MRLLVEVESSAASWRSKFQELSGIVAGQYPHHARLVAAECAGGVRLWLSLGIEPEAFGLLESLATRHHFAVTSAHLARLTWMNLEATGDSEDSHLFAVSCRVAPEGELPLAERLWYDPALRWHAAVTDVSHQRWIFLVGCDAGSESLGEIFTTHRASDLLTSRLFYSTLIR